MRRLFANLQYAVTPALILLSLYGLARGGDWVWLGVALLGAAIIADTLLIWHTKGAGKDKQGRKLGIPFFLNGLLYVIFPVFILQQLALAWRVYSYVTGIPGEIIDVHGIQISTATTGWELVGSVLSAGIWQGMGIVFGHELSHTKGWTFVLSRWIMALSGSAHFAIAHVYNHHVDLGDAADPATAPRGRSLYAHFVLSHTGQSAWVARAEGERLAKQGKGFWTLSNRWIRGYFMSIPTILLFAYAGGWSWVGFAIAAGLWFISNFELEVLNYLEHYGLIREPGKPIEHRHSWDNDTFLTSIAFIEIGRQGDHHVRGETRFWDLEPTGAPNYGWGYLTLLVVALFPPAWHAVMKPKLAAWDRDFANPAERAIAADHNRKAGYDLPAVFAHQTN